MSNGRCQTTVRSGVSSVDLNEVCWGGEHGTPLLRSLACASPSGCGILWCFGALFWGGFLCGYVAQRFTAICLMVPPDVTPRCDIARDVHAGVSGGFRVPGSPEACPSGFSRRADGTCEDVDECHIFPTICKNGKCMNMIGGYACECDQGFAPVRSGAFCVKIHGPGGTLLGDGAHDTEVKIT